MTHFFLVESLSIIAHQRMDRGLERLHFSLEHGGHGRENCAFGFPLGTKIFITESRCDAAWGHVILSESRGVFINYRSSMDDESRSPSIASNTFF
jgi:hypothetical protein